MYYENLDLPFNGQLLFLFPKDIGIEIGIKDMKRYYVRDRVAKLCLLFKESLTICPDQTLKLINQSV